jgi:predicted ATPase
MITHFEVSNFKSLKHLSQDMRRFMVLVGPNGAGKTNLVRALEVFGQILHRGTVEPVQEHGYDQLIRREKRPARKGLHFSLQFELPAQMLKRVSVRANTFRDRTLLPIPDKALTPNRVTLRVSLGIVGSIHTNDADIQYEVLQLKSDNGYLEVSLSPNGPEFNHAGTPFLWDILATELIPTTSIADLIGILSPQSEKERLAFARLAFSPDHQGDPNPHLLRLINWQRNPSPSLRYMRDISKVTRLRLDASALRREFSSGESHDALLGPAGEGLAHAVSKLRGPRPTPSAEFRELLEALQEVYPRIEDVYARRIPSGHLILLFKERGISEELGQANVSDGVLHALALLVALHQGASRQAGLLAIEEPENALHPWALRKLIARAQESSRQVLLTTHSETVVNAVTDPENLFLVENDDKRGTVITQATERESALRSILEESGQRLGDIWLDGSLGGVPGSKP